MNYDPKIHHRKSIRLKNYDYSQAGLYFVTICTQYYECFFGEIINGKMVLNDAGKMIKFQWAALPKRFHNIEINEYIIMPNHFHGIIELTVGAPLVGALSLVDAQIDTQSQLGQPETGQPKPGQPQGIAPTVGDIIGAFKSITTNEYIRGVKNKKWQRFNGKLWQRNYWEHIVRSENEYHRIAEYINYNPEKWDDDQLNNGAGKQVMEPHPIYRLESWMV